MKKPTSRIFCPLVTAIAALTLAPHAHAGGFALTEQNAVAGGTAGASTARSDDAGAAWYNPAALADDAGTLTSDTGGWEVGS